MFGTKKQQKQQFSALNKWIKTIENTEKPICHILTLVLKLQLLENPINSFLPLASYIIKLYAPPTHRWAGSTQPFTLGYGFRHQPKPGAYNFALCKMLFLHSIQSIPLPPTGRRFWPFVPPPHTTQAYVCGSVTARQEYSFMPPLMPHR